MLMASSQPSPRSHPASPPPAPRGMEESILDFGEMDSLADFLQEEDMLVNSDQWQLDINDVGVVPSKLQPASLLDGVQHLDNSYSSSQFTLTTSLNSARPKVNEESESSMGAAAMSTRSMPYSVSDQKHDSFAMSHSELTAASGADESSLPHTTAVYTASTVPVEKPNINDVLLGRGGRNNQWSGNETLREMARTMAAHYSAAPKRNKPAIAMLLVQKIRALTPSGRFLKQEQAVGSWMEVDEEVAREKASQCLRDIVAAMTKHKLKNGNSSASDLFLNASASTSNLRQTSVSSMQRNSSVTSSATDVHHRSVASFFGNRTAVETSRMGNAEWNIPIAEPSPSDAMARFSAVGRMPPSAAARAGLALLQRGGPPNPQSGNPNGLVASQNNSTNDVASAMQISSGNLSELHHSSVLASGTMYGTAPQQGHVKMAGSVEPKEFSMRFSAPDFDGDLSRPDGTNKRTAMSASAPNLGDISLFLAKRRRSAVNMQWPGESSGMQNATFSNMPSIDNALEPVQVDMASGRPIGGRAMSMMTLGSTGIAKNVRQVDPLMQRLQALRSNMHSHTATGTTTNEIDYRDPDMTRRLSIVREQDNSMGNFNWNPEVEPQPQSGMESTAEHNRSMFASALQPPKTNDSFNCFSGMGAVMGESDDNALQRWIDRMAEEEFS